MQSDKSYLDPYLESLNIFAMNMDANFNQFLFRHEEMAGIDFTEYGKALWLNIIELFTEKQHLKQ